MVEATVVIPARNAAGTIEHQLAALERQRGVDHLEVIVVDNGSTDDTRAIVERWCERLEGLRLVSATERAGPSYARNVGIEAAASDRILLCDADDVVEPDWARRMLAALDGADAVSGYSRWVDPQLRFLQDDEPFAPRLGFLPGFSGANSALSRDVWRAVGGFDEELQTAEDLDFAWRLQLRGYRLVREDRAVIQYRQRTGDRAVFVQGYHHGQGSVRVFQRYRALGMPRSSTTVALKVWLRLVVSGLTVWSDPGARSYWARRVGTRLGRLTESVRRGVLYL